MKLQELRIGNYIEAKLAVFGKGKWTLSEVNYIDCDSTAINGKVLGVGGKGFGMSSPDHENNFRPIKLTKKWLLKFGFDKDKSRWEKTFIGKNGMEYQDLILHQGDNNYFSWFIPGIMVRQIEFVHELQNLFFGVNNKELTSSNPNNSNSKEQK